MSARCDRVSWGDIRAAAKMVVEAVYLCTHLEVGSVQARSCAACLGPRAGRDFGTEKDSCFMVDRAPVRKSMWWCRGCHLSVV
eukprot:gene718-799_t